jgi:hypothetical protein
MSAEAAISAMEECGADPGTLLLRYGVIQMLNIQSQDLRASNDVEQRLLDVYKHWIEVALNYMGPAPDVTSRDYLYASATLTAELHLASGGKVPQGGRGAVQVAPMSQS